MKKIIYFLNKIKKLIFLFLSFSLILFDFNGVGKIKVSRFFCYLCARCVVTADLLLLALRLRLFFFLSPFFIICWSFSRKRHHAKESESKTALQQQMQRENVCFVHSVWFFDTFDGEERERVQSYTIHHTVKTLMMR